jgi:phospholipid/cholesterol/gamma-HCH transport system substrate-binding protein
MITPDPASTRLNPLGAAVNWRALVGLATVSIIVGIAVLAALMFQGKLTRTEPVTVLSQRAGLVMNPGAKVELLGVDVGRVSSIEVLPGGQAALHLAIDPRELPKIPADVRVDIAAPTVFGAKMVQLIPPQNAAAQRLSPGAVLKASRVTVEVNTLFQQLTAVLAKIDPAKLNETLGAIAAAFDGRGERIGHAMVNLNRLLGTLEPSLPNLTRDLQYAADASSSYADATPDLITVADRTSQISDTVIDERSNLDSLLISATGLARTGSEVLATTAQPLAQLLRLLVPTTALTNQYNPTLTCTLKGLSYLGGTVPPSEFPGVVTSAGFVLGEERYRYPMNLPKVAATGGPHCADVGLPIVPPNTRVPIVVADDGADPTAYGNQGILLNSDTLKQWLFGPLDGPPRNTAQIGQPG